MKDNDLLLMIVLAFFLGYMVREMMKQMCGDNLIEGIETTAVFCPKGMQEIVEPNKCTVDCETGGDCHCSNNPDVLVYQKDVLEGEGYETANNMYCEKCEVGHHNATAGGGCVNCAPGFYQSSRGQTSCVACEPGTHISSPGATECTDCEAGTYSSSAGAAECIPCPAGKKSSAGATECTDCEAGTYSSSTGAAECGSCPPGSWSGVGDSGCGSCLDVCGKLGSEVPCGRSARPWEDDHPYNCQWKGEKTQGQPSTNAPPVKTNKGCVARNKLVLGDQYAVVRADMAKQGDIIPDSVPNSEVRDWLIGNNYLDEGERAAVYCKWYPYGSTN